MAGVAGSTLGPKLYALLGKRTPTPGQLAAGLAALGCTPLLLLACSDPRPALYLPALVAGTALLFAAVHPASRALFESGVPQDSSLTAVALLAVRVAGEVPGPLVVGALADASSLGRAILAVPAAALVAGALFAYAGRGRIAEEASAGRER
jgi:MFS-type transporter involved in bile tolerance (Atg22 family)